MYVCVHPVSVADATESRLGGISGRGGVIARGKNTVKFAAAGRAREPTFPRKVEKGGREGEKRREGTILGDSRPDKTNTTLRAGRVSATQNGNSGETSSWIMNVTKSDFVRRSRLISILAELRYN